MKILLIASKGLPVPSYEGGAIEQLVTTYLKYNEQLFHDDIDVYSIKPKKEKVYSNEKYNKYFYINKRNVFYKMLQLFYKIINLNKRKYFGDSFIQKVISLVEKDIDKYDLIIVENNVQYIPLLKQKFNKKIILHLHNDYLNKENNYYKKVFNNCDKIITVSDFLHKQVDSMSEKVVTIHSGINIEKITTSVISKIEELRKKHMINDETITFGYVGRIIPIKGVKELIEAFNDLNYKNVKLLIIGDVGHANYKNIQYLKKIKELSKNNKNIIFTGFVDNDNLSNYYQIMDVVVIPSICNEALCLTAIEALANQKQVIASDRGGLVEVVNEDFGYLIDTNNLKDNLLRIMNKILNNKTIIYDKKKLKEHIIEFSEEEYVHKLYNELHKK